MGALISRLRQGNDSDYEKILSDLDSNIRKAELRLSAIKIREKRFAGLWLVYSVLAWVGYAAVFAFYLHHEYADKTQTWALAFAPIALGFPIIYAGRSLINIWYKRAQTNEESQLSLLRADQRLKVEELKKKTAYYSTKTLLERYDPSSQQQRVSGPRPGPDGKPMHPAQNGQRPMRPNMMDPGLRQRTGLGVTNAQGAPLGMGPQGQGQGQGLGQVQGRPMGTSSGMQPPGGNMHGPRGPQGSFPPQSNYQNQQFSHGSPLYGSPNTEKHWYDKIVDVIVGDEGPDTKYALICGQCYAHNGLVLPQEIDDIQYVCPKCNYLNPPRRKTATAGRPITSPDATLLQAREQPLPASRDPSPSPLRHPVPEHDEYDSSENPGPMEDRHQDQRNDKSEEHSENSIEFVNNWNDSDLENSGEDEDVDVDTDDAPGYIVQSEPSEDVEGEVKAKSPKKKPTRSSTSNSGKKTTKRS
ncbi:hypothetical protein BG006_006872 [Podila minutissima]|uniref:Endoplasmic reticulum junction formation protein lunapark n=1 Tax=Podila minutissima TaxID=64525 RepID=A0A9P5VL18_9FUNG|nr:hypothetical protein BG006_006872 [Podila minutissima]